MYIHPIETEGDLHERVTGHGGHLSPGPATLAVQNADDLEWIIHAPYQLEPELPRPASRARMAACVRSATCNLLKMLET